MTSPRTFFTAAATTLALAAVPAGAALAQEKQPEPTPTTPPTEQPAPTADQKLQKALKKCAKNKGAKKRACVRRAKNKYGS